MDALIRSAKLGPSRLRLSETRGVDASADPDAQKKELRALRADIEKQVRAELALQLQELRDAERERAQAEGYAAGIAEAQADAAQQLSQAREQFKASVASALSALEQAHRSTVARLEASVGEVTFAVVCRLIGEKAATQSFVLGLVERACVQLRTDAIATARLHPRDIHVLRELLHDAELRIQSLALKVVSDESLELGGCVIEAASGQYDGGLESQLRRLHGVLTGSGAAESPRATAVDVTTAGKG